MQNPFETQKIWFWSCVGALGVIFLMSIVAIALACGKKKRFEAIEHDLDLLFEDD